VAEQVRFDLEQVLHSDGRHGPRQITLAKGVQAPEWAESINVQVQLTKLSHKQLLSL
jgi:hypothetical protein